MSLHRTNRHYVPTTDISIFIAANQFHTGICFPLPRRAWVNSRTSFSSPIPSTSDMTRSAPAFRIAFGNFPGLAPGLTIGEHNLDACATPLGEFGNKCLSGLHRHLFHQRHHVRSPPAVFLELSHRHIAVEKRHGKADRKAM